MLPEIRTQAGTVRPGTRIHILQVNDTTTILPGGVDTQARSMNGTEGTVTLIDDSRAIHGTLGGLSVLPDVDRFQIVN